MCIIIVLRFVTVVYYSGVVIKFYIAMLNFISLLYTWNTSQKYYSYYKYSNKCTYTATQWVDNQVYNKLEYTNSIQKYTNKNLN